MHGYGGLGHVTHETQGDTLASHQGSHSELQTQRAVAPFVDVPRGEASVRGGDHGDQEFRHLSIPCWYRNAEVYVLREVGQGVDDSYEVGIHFRGDGDTQARITQLGVKGPRVFVGVNMGLILKGRRGASLWDPC